MNEEIFFFKLAEIAYGDKCKVSEEFYEYFNKKYPKKGLLALVDYIMVEVILGESFVHTTHGFRYEMPELYAKYSDHYDKNYSKLVPEIYKLCYYLRRDGHNKYCDKKYELKSHNEIEKILATDMGANLICKFCVILRATGIIMFIF